MNIEPNVHRPIFYPRPTQVPPTFVVRVGDVQLGCHLQNPYIDAGMIVYFHGNGELAAECDRHLSEFLLELGANICFVEYRGYGASTGQPEIVAMMDDGEAVVRALGVPPERIVAFGRSLGSLFAVELARRFPSIAGLILESGIADFFERFNLMGEPPQERSQFPLLEQQPKLHAYQQPLLVLHAEQDRLVDVSHGRRLHEWAASAEKKLVVFPRGDHNSILPVNLHTYGNEVEQFLERVGIRSAIR